MLEEQGFVEHRREDNLELDPSAALAWLDAHPGPSLRTLGVDDVGLDALRALDEELRDDVPGTDGWRWDPAAFAGGVLVMVTLGIGAAWWPARRASSRIINSA